MTTQHPYLTSYQTRGAILRSVGAAARPSAQSILLLIAPFLLAVSLIPASKGIMFRVPPLPSVWWTVNLMLLFCGLVVVFRWINCAPYRLAPSTKRWFLIPILLLGMLQIVSMAWNGRDSDMRWYSLVQSMGMCASVTSGVLLVSGLPQETRIRIGRGVTLLLAFVVAVYMSLSFVFPAWRPSTAWKDWTTGSLGFIRVFGPLGPATTLNFALIPALGFSFGMIFLRRSFKTFWTATAIFFVVASLATGSRGSVLSLASFGLLLIVSLRLRSLFFLFPVAIVLATIIAAVGVPERYRHFEDPARWETNVTALRAFSASARNVTVGNGHGSLYSSLHDHALRKLRGRTRWYLLSDRTAFGYSLRSSHTALLRTLAETGLVGFALLLAPLLWTLFRLLVPWLRDLRNPAGIHAVCTLTGCVAMIPYMAADEFFVGSFWIVFLWTMFVVVGAEGGAEIVRS